MTPSRLLYPVIHLLSAEQAIRNADVAAENGADGVFLIHMGGKDHLLDAPAAAVKGRHPRLFVGTNRLSTVPWTAIARDSDLGLDGTWADACRVSGARPGPWAPQINDALASARARNPRFAFLGSVAFKYQEPEPDPAAAAVTAADLGWIPTTSGPGTGQAADVGKIEAMKRALGDRPLALASGVTPGNARLFLPHVDVFLVATGISKGFHELDPALVRTLADLVHQPDPAETAERPNA